MGTNLVNKFSREIDFSNILFKSSHQKMSWKLVGATNLYLQRNLIFRKVANLLLHCYISKTFLVFRNSSCRLFPRIEDRVKCTLFRKHTNHIICKDLFLCWLNMSFCRFYKKHSQNEYTWYFKPRKFVEPIEIRLQQTLIFVICGY